MNYLSAEDILVIHARIIDETGGSHGIRDLHRLASIAERPKMQFGGRELYPTLFDKAAAYFESAAMDHPFIDGNKRTAVAIAARFLFLNGCELHTSSRVLEQFVLRAVVKKYSIHEVAKWLEAHSKKIGSDDA